MLGVGMQTRGLCIQILFDCTRLFFVVFVQWVCNRSFCELKGNKVIINAMYLKHKEHRARLPVSDYRCVQHLWSAIHAGISNSSCCLWSSLAFCLYSVLQMDTACDDLVDLLVHVCRFTCISVTRVTQRLRPVCVRVCVRVVCSVTTGHEHLEPVKLETWSKSETKGTFIWQVRSEISQINSYFLLILESCLAFAM